MIGTLMAGGFYVPINKQMPRLPIPLTIYETRSKFSQTKSQTLDDITWGPWTTPTTCSCPDLTNNVIISNCFKEVLHRAPDLGGGRNWVPPSNIHFPERIHFRFSILIAKIKHWIIAIIFRYRTSKSIVWSKRNRTTKMKIFSNVIRSVQFSIVNLKAYLELCGGPL